MRNGYMNNFSKEPTTREYDNDDWRDDANCIGADPEIFFASDQKADVEIVKKAKAKCSSCLAQVACLRYALETDQNHGIWGGQTEKERRMLKRSAIASGRTLRDIIERP